jgi:type IV pilus assembly protein PilV
MRNRNPAFRNAVAGVSLIEVLISVLIMGIGMLGIAAMQATALRNNQSALDRSQAVVQSYTILDAMRANRKAALAGDYNNPSMVCEAGDTGSLADDDIAAWVGSLKATMGPAACGSVNCDSNNVCTVTVQWDESNLKDGSDEQKFATVTQI